MDLNDKVAVVTGAGRGLGAAIARRLAQAGARVVVADVDDATAQATAAALRELGRDALAVCTDVSVVADARRLVEATLARFGRLDVLVNNAGICPLATIEEVTEEL